MIGDITSALKNTIIDAAQVNDIAFQIMAGNTKQFLGREPSGMPLSLSEHRGIINYQPKELVITARCGTPLTEIEAALAEHGQMLAFEPPYFGEQATLGGTVAAGLSGPRRPYTGSVRDFVLGVRLMDGRGESLRFGGEVMKNVAGYDVSRLVTGAMGTLGIILDVSLKVLPIPAEEITLIQERATIDEAIGLMNTWAARPFPLSATCFYDRRLYIRLSGASSAVGVARARLGGELLEDDSRFWTDIRNQCHEFFIGNQGSMWRISVPTTARHLPLQGDWFIEWGGGQRWLWTELTIDPIRRLAAAAGGHATLFRADDRRGYVFHPLSTPLARLHQRVKQVFDPHGLFNPGRLYPDW